MVFTNVICSFKGVVDIKEEKYEYLKKGNSFYFKYQLNF